MPYCAILVPEETNNTEERDESLFSSISGKLMSGVSSGGISFDNATTVLKNTADVLLEAKDDLTTKFAGVGLVQLLTQGKITNETAFDYLTQGFPQALNQSAIALGFQSVDQLKTALKSENGVNVQQFIKAFENAGTAITSLFSSQKNRENVEGYAVIEIDATQRDNRSYASETPDRRVQSGQTYQEYIHNLPDILTLDCVLQDGRNYGGDDFEELMLNIRDRKIAVNLILGDVIKENFVLTNFVPNRENLMGYKYTLEFKKINIGNVQLVPLDITIATNINPVENKLVPDETKTCSEVCNGLQQPEEEKEKDDGNNFLKVIWAGLRLGFGGL